jgi:hypothetical protein
MCSDNANRFCRRVYRSRRSIPSWQPGLSPTSDSRQMCPTTSERCVVRQGLRLKTACDLTGEATQESSVDSALRFGPSAQLLPDEFLYVVPVDLAHINGALGIDRDGRGVVQSFDLLKDLAVFDARNE